MLKIIQTVKATVDAIQFDELEKEDALFETVQFLEGFDGEIEKPDPLAEEDEQKLRELLKTEAPFEEIRKFVEYLRCKDQDILFVQPSNRDPKEGPDIIRGRTIKLMLFPEKEPEQDPSSTFQ